MLLTHSKLHLGRGPKKAAIAVAASMLTSAYHMLKHGTVYQDLGETHYSNRDRADGGQSNRRAGEVGAGLEPILSPSGG